MISAVMPVQKGISQNGNSYMKQEFVIDYFWWSNQTTASKMYLNIFGEEKVKNADLKVGDEVKVRYHIEAREYNGRWYNDVRCDYVERLTPKPEVPTTVDKPGASHQQPEQAAEGAETKDGNDDLPF